MIKRPVTVAPEFKGMIEAAGFVDVVVERAIWPTNTWAKDPKLKELSMWS